MTITKEIRELMEQIDRDRLPIRVKFGAVIRGRFRWFAAAGNKHAEIPKVHNHRRLSYDERMEWARSNARGLRAALDAARGSDMAVGIFQGRKLIERV